MFARFQTSMLSKPAAMSAKAPKNKGQQPAAHSPVSLAIPVTKAPAAIPGWQAAVERFIQQWQGSLQVLVYGIGVDQAELEADDALQVLQEKTDLTIQSGYPAIGAALQAAAAEAGHAHLLTWAGNNTVKPEAVRSWAARQKGGLPEEAILIAQREVTDKASRKALRALEGKAAQRFRGATNMRLSDPASPVKCYPTALAAYLFQQIPHDQPCFEAAALHWAELEGVQVQEIAATPNLEEVATHTDQPSGSPRLAALRFKVHYQLRHPLQVLSKGEQPARPAFMRAGQHGLKLAFSALLLLVFVGMPLLSFDYGATGDENLQDNYGEKLVDYYTSFGSDESALNYKDLYLYGGLFEVVASGTANLVNPLIEGNYRYEIRHVLNALAGFVAILFTALLGKYLGGWRGGLLALLILILSPRFFGHAMNNPKDIPFAAFYVMGVYFLVKLLAELPRPDRRTMGWLIVAIGAAISVRIGGLLLIAYLGLFLLVALFRQGSTDRGAFFRQLVRIGLITGVGGYLAGLIFWPYGHQNPFLNPFRALSNMSDFPTVISVLFEGQVIQSANVPWYYLLKYLAYTAPLLAIGSFALFIFLIPFWRPKQQLYWYWPVVFAAAFPVFYIIYKGSNLYDGMRQALFVYPPFVLTGSFALQYLFERWQQRGVRIAVTAAIGGLLAIPFWFMVSNHPNQVVYYNSLLGGLEEAYGEYELDYWGNSTKQAANRLGAEILKDGTPDSMIQVKANLAHGCRSVLERKSDSINVQYASYKERSRKDWDYAIFVLRFVPPRVLTNYWPPAGTQEQIKVNGTPVATIVKRNNYHDLKGFEHLSTGEFREAARDFEAYREYNPQNASVLNALARCYARTNQLQAAQAVARQALEISPGSFQALGVMGRVYQEQGKVDQAIRLYERAVRQNRRYARGYFQLGQLYYQKQQPRQALRYLSALRQVRPALYKRASSLVKRCQQMARQR
jgi:tetratricopeptide (TPR) repeat protein